MAFTFIAAASGASIDQINAVTSPNINSTGADLAVVYVTGIDNSAFAITEGANTYNGLTQHSAGAGAETDRMYYFFNPSQSATFNVSVAAAGNYPGIAVALFSGSHASPFDQQNGNAAATGTTRQPGSITPSEGNCVVVCGVQTVYDNSGLAIDGGFTIPTNGSDAFNAAEGFGVAIAYLIQTTATAANPTWSGTGSPDFRSSSIASFKSAAGGGGGSSAVPVFMNQYRQRRS